MGSTHTSKSNLTFAIFDFKGNFQLIILRQKEWFSKYFILLNIFLRSLRTCFKSRLKNFASKQEKNVESLIEESVSCWHQIIDRNRVIWYEISQHQMIAAAAAAAELWRNCDLAVVHFSILHWNIGAAASGSWNRS